MKTRESHQVHMCRIAQCSLSIYEKIKNNNNDDY